MGHVSTTDVEFFNMVHELRAMAREWATLSDQRTAERRTFCCRQWVAPRRHEQTPTDWEFRPVDCRDISTTGFSFLVDDVPQAHELHVRFGKPGAYVVVNATVVHCIPVDTDVGPEFLVGCRFLQKSETANDAVPASAVA